MSPVQEQIFVATPILTGKQQIISSPFQFYCDGTERLLLVAASSFSPPAEAQVTYRWMRPDGAIQVVEQRFSLPADRVPRIFNLPLEQGFLLNMQVRGLGATQIGQTYVAVWLERGNFLVGPNCGVLLAGYVTNLQTLGWPGSPIIASTEGQGVMLSITIPTPAPTLGFTVVVPTNTRWAPLSLYGEYTTHPAGGGSGDFTLIYVAGGRVTARIEIAGFQAAGLTRLYTWGRGLTHTTGNISTSIFRAPMLTETILEAGASLSGGVDVGSGSDTWDNVTLRIQEWLAI